MFLLHGANTRNRDRPQACGSCSYRPHPLRKTGDESGFSANRGAFLVPSRQLGSKGNIIAGWGVVGKTKTRASWPLGSEVDCEGYAAWLAQRPDSAPDRGPADRTVPADLLERVGHSGWGGVGATGLPVAQVGQAHCFPLKTFMPLIKHAEQPGPCAAAGLGGGFTQAQLIQAGCGTGGGGLQRGNESQVQPILLPEFHAVRGSSRQGVRFWPAGIREVEGRNRRPRGRWPGPFQGLRARSAAFNGVSLEQTSRSGWNLGSATYSWLQASFAGRPVSHGRQSTTGHSLVAAPTTA